MTNSTENEMSEDGKRIVEVHGVKLEIDERTARTVESYRVGDRVKVLTKEYGDSYKIRPGVIVGFAAFETLPSIEVMYLATESWETGDPLKFVAINEKSKDIEIAPMNEAEVVLDMADVVERIDRELRKRRLAVEDLEKKQAYFVERYAAAFEPIPSE